MSKDAKGISVTKDDFSEWYTQLIQKAELIEYSPVSGCYILRPNAYFIWEQVQSYVDKKIKEEGVRNCYFPLFIPESLLTKEKEHVEGFAPEVAWVDFGGNTKLGERLAVRPTSETIMYDAYAKWIKSYNDLPLLLNQWNNVVRWEFKHCTPFLRSREFLWQEGHTAFATQEEAVAENYKILNIYEDTFRELYAIPVIQGRKSESEKFAGADFTISCEAFLPNGKAIQGCTSHYLGQNFAKAFGIEFIDQNQQKQYVHQNSWAITTRSIGVAVLMHSDNKGLVLPPRVASVQVVIVPILFDATKDAVLKKAHELFAHLKSKGIRVHLDAREQYSSGWKFNDWEMKGTPVRLEIGPKDLEKKHVMLARRDTGEKMAVPFEALDAKIPELLTQIHEHLYQKAKKFLTDSTVTVETLADAEKQLENKKLLFGAWCNKPECEAKFKEKAGAKTINSPFEQAPIKGKKCFICQDAAHKWFYFGRSY